MSRHSNEGPKDMARKVGIVAVAAAALVGTLYMGGVLGSTQSYDALKNYAIVQSLDAPELTLVDVRKDEVAGIVELPSRPDQVLVSAGADRIVYSNRAERTVNIYDLEAQQVEATVELPFSPDNMVLAPDGYSLAAAGAEERMVAIVSLIDTALVGVVEEVSNPLGMTFSDSSEYLFVSDSEAGGLAVIDAIAAMKIDPVSLEFGATAAVGTDLTPMTRTPNGLYGVVVDRESGQMPVINFRNWTQIDTIRLGDAPSRPYGTADGQYMLVANTGDQTISVISTEHFETAASLPGVESVTGISTGFFELLAFVVSDTENRAVLVDLETMQAAGEVPLPGTPGVPVADSEGRRIYVPLRDENALVVFDAFDRKILKTIKGVGSSPVSVALAESNNYCH